MLHALVFAYALFAAALMIISFTMLMPMPHYDADAFDAITLALMF